VSWAHAQIRASFPGPRRRREPTLEDRAVAHVLAPWLDRELCAGAAASLSAAHAARAGQLTKERTRRALARSLDRLIERADETRPRSLIVPLPPCREQVRDATALILSTAARLRSPEPLEPQAIARLKTLLRDFGGPCYVRSRPDALTIALRDVSNELDVQPRGPRPASG
jgi:hypothetical protein